MVKTSDQIIKLPAPWYHSEVSVEEAMKERRSNRRYQDLPLQINQVGQLCWAAQGITSSRGFRTAPSAGALYPLEIIVVSGRIDGLDAGVYRYQPDQHELIFMYAGDVRTELSRAALSQQSVQLTPVNLVICAVYERTHIKYRDRAVRYVHMEAGHASQNIYLQAVSLGLKTVAIGAFQDDRVADVLHLEEAVEPLYIMPVGR